MIINKIKSLRKKRIKIREMNTQLDIDNIAQSYSLLQMKNAFTGEMLETWFRPDMMLFVERWVMEKGKVVDKFRILPNTNDVFKIGHIDFTKHYYTDFEDAVSTMCTINVA